MSIGAGVGHFYFEGPKSTEYFIFFVLGIFSCAKLINPIPVFRPLAYSLSPSPKRTISLLKIQLHAAPGARMSSASLVLFILEEKLKVLVAEW